MGPNTVSKTDGGLCDDREYSVEVMYNDSDLDSTSGDDEDIKMKMMRAGDA